jgi:hypothetical protein
MEEMALELVEHVNANMCPLVPQLCNCVMSDDLTFGHRATSCAESADAMVRRDTSGRLASLTDLRVRVSKAYEHHAVTTRRGPLVFHRMGTILAETGFSLAPNIAAELERSM